MGPRNHKNNGIMGRPRKKAADNPAQQPGFEDETDAQDPDLQDSEAATVAKVQAALSDRVDSEWVIRVNQVIRSPQGTRLGWAFDADIQDLSTLRDKISAECGPGRYRVRVMRDGMPFKQYDLEIIMTHSRRAALAPVAIAATAPAPAYSADGISPGLLRILENQNTMIQAIINRPAPTMTDLLGQMRLMQEVMPKPVAPDTGFDMFMKALDVVTKMIPKAATRPIVEAAEEASPLLGIMRDAIKEFAPVVRDAMAQRMAQPAAQALPAPNPAPLVAPPPADGDMAAKMAHFEKFKAYILEQAQKGTDPAMIADYAQEAMPKELWDAIGQVDDPLAMAMKVFPEAEPHRAWFARLIELFFEDDEAEEEEDPPAPDVEQPSDRPN